MGVLRLKDFIRAIRGCKTAADERAVIAKESAAIRTSFKEDQSLETRNINISKMLYIHMLGHPAHYGQIECLKLVAGGKYPDKRLGYLGIMLLLDENQEVLTLVTNSLKNDMNSSNMYTVGLALCTLGNIASPEMSRDLCPEVEKLLGSSNSYIKKKAALCAIRVMHKVPDLVDQFLVKAKALLSEKNHAVLLTGMVLVSEICKIHPESIREFRTFVPHLTRLVKNLLSVGSSPEHEVVGINDPFLQVKTLRLLRVLARGDREASDSMNDVLAQIATNTDSSKNAGNAILYETCLTIMDIEADAGLRVLAINILGRFLSNIDNNIRYVALNTLTKTVNVDMNAVQRHRATVLACLRDSDISIRRRALELSFALINETNIRVMVRELLVFLEIADAEFLPIIPVKICAAADEFAPNKRWHIDTVVRVLKLAGNYVKDDVLSNFIKLVASVPELHSYAVYKLFYSLKQDQSQESLVLASVWCVGEYGEVLLQSAPKTVPADDPLDEQPQETQIQDVNEKDIVDLLESILEGPYASLVVSEYVLNAMLKLTTRVKDSTVVDRIRAITRKFLRHINIEMQQRSSEYNTLLTDPNLVKIRAGVLERMPVPPPVSSAERRAQRMAATASPISGSPGRSPAPGISPTAAGPDAGKKKSGSSGGLLDDLLGLDQDLVQPAAVPGMPGAAPAATGGLDLLSQLGGMSLMGGPVPAAAAAAPQAPAASGIDLLAGVFGGPAAAPTGPKTTSDIMNLFGAPKPTGTSPVNPALGLGGSVSPSSMMGMGMLGGLGSSGMPATMAPNPTSTQGLDLLGGLGSMMGGSTASTGAMKSNPTPTTAAPVVSSTNVSPLSALSPLSNISSGMSSTLPSANGMVLGPSEAIAYNKNNLQITFRCTMEPGPDANASIALIHVQFRNTNPYPITDLQFQVAVPKHLKLQLLSASGTVVPPAGSGVVTQSMKVLHAQGKLPEGKTSGLRLRLKLVYAMGATKVDEMVDFGGFGPQWSW